MREKRTQTTKTQSKTMSNFCKTCGEYIFDCGHTCPPKFYIWCDDYGEAEEDASTIFSRNGAEGAAGSAHLVLSQL